MNGDVRSAPNLALIFSIFLGISIATFIYGGGERPLVQAATSACPNGNYQCECGKPPPEGQKGPCLKGCQICQGVANGHVCPGQCMGPGVPGCKTIGSCDGEKLGGKPEGAPEGQGGGQPPQMPQMPQGGGGGGGGGQPPPTTGQEDCGAEPKPAHCQNQGVSGLINSWFGGSSTTSRTSTSSPVSSVANTLLSFITGGNNASSQNTSSQTGSTAQENTNNSGNANSFLNTVQSVVTTWLAPSKTSSESNTSVQSQTGQPVGQVTGFGANTNTQADTSSGVFDAIGQALSGIGIALQNILGSLF